MNDAANLPVEARTWLRATDRLLRDLPDDYRAETLSGLSEHLTELTADGLNGSEAVARLGSPTAVAEDAFAQYEQQTGIDLRPRYFTAKRVVQLVALVIALAGALAIALLPGYIEVTESTDSTEQVDSATVLEVNGTWYLLALAIPVVLTALPLLVRGKAWQLVSVVCVVLLTMFTAVGMFSIGWYFVFAWVVALVALFFPTRPRKRGSGI